MNNLYFPYSCRVKEIGPLPFYCSKQFHCLIFILYLFVQVYTCKLCAQWRQGIRIYRVVPVDHDNLHTVNQNTSFTNQSFLSSRNWTNETTSFIPADFDSNSAIGNSTKIIYEGVPPLYAHASLAFMFHFGIYICLFAFRTKHQILFSLALNYMNSIDAADSETCRKSRSIYIKRSELTKHDEKTLKDILTLSERGILFRWWNAIFIKWNSRMHFINSNYPTIDCTLADYMFFNLTYNGDYQILGAIEILYEVMKALDFFHYRNTYHLDLRPESVKLHCNGQKVYVKLSNFNFMKKAVDKKIASTAVGLKGFYRPLECSIEHEVDAEKCDTWGLGMISLDLFTGGMFRIKSEAAEEDINNKEEFIRAFLQRRPFFGYVQEVYRVVEMFQDVRYCGDIILEIQQIPEKPQGLFGFGWTFRTLYGYRTYQVDHLNFLYDIRCFVYRLLIFSPRRRITLARAFNEPLMKKRLLPKIREVPLESV